MAFLIPPGMTDPVTPQTVQRRRQLAEAMLANNTSGPVRHWTEGAARLAKALIGGAGLRQADELETKGRKEAQDSISQLTQALMGEERAQPSQSGNPSYRDAISSIESGGRYDAVGPTNPKLGRALGKYQVMEANVGPWSREALGREVSADEFLSSPEIQDKVFDHRFGQYVSQYGPEKAAQAWFAGPGDIGTNRQDSLGTSVPEYSRKFMAAMGGGDQPAMPEGATPTSGQQQPQGGSRLQQLFAAAQNPWLDEGQRALVNTLIQNELKSSNQGLENIDLGDRIGFFDRQGNLVRSVPKAGQQKAATYGVIGKDQYGTEQYGWIDPITRTVTPAPSGSGQEAGAAPVDAQPLAPPPQAPAPAQEGAQQPPMAAPIQIPPAPPGVNPKIWRDEQTKIAAEKSAAKTLANHRREVNEDVIGNAADQARKLINGWTTGMVGNALSNLSSSQAAELRRQIDVLKSNATIENLNAMRQSSPTGGALGNVTEKEGAMLASATGALDAAASEEDFRRALDNYERTLYRITYGPEEGDAVFRRRMQGGTQQPQASTARAPAPPKPGEIQQGYRFKGGNPADPNSWEQVQ